jgi:hypothetical protein
MASKELSAEALAKLKDAMDVAEVDLDNAKLAYFHGAPYKDEEVTYERLKTYAETFIAHNYAFQKAKFGKVHVKLAVARLLRE